MNDDGRRDYDEPDDPPEAPNDWAGAATYDAATDCAGAYDAATDGAGAYNPDGVDTAVELVNSLSRLLPPPKIGPKKRARPAPRRSSTGMEPVGEVFDDVAAQYGWQEGFTLQAMRARWPELVGDVNAQHSAPERLRDGVLTVRADSSTWASALRLMAPRLVAKLNEAVGDGSVTSVDVKGPNGPSWKHGLRSVRDGRGPRDTYG